MTTKLKRTLFGTGVLGVAGCVWAASLDLPTRQSPRPETTNSVPHMQIGVEPIAEFSDEIVHQAGRLPDVSVGATRVSLPGAIGFHLDADLPLAHEEAIAGGREFAHIHPDGSLHASLDPEIARQAIDAGWAISHPWSDQRDGWSGFVMIYTPQTNEELAVVNALVRSSYEYVTGVALTPVQ